MPRLLSLKNLILFILSACVFISDTSLVSAADPIEYQTQILPILRENCFQCHSDEKSEGGLQLDSQNSILKGGDSQQPIFGMSIESSEVFKRITSDDPDYKMPPKGDSLSKSEIDLVQKWIEQGGDFKANSKSNQSGKNNGGDSAKLIGGIYKWFLENAYSFWTLNIFIFLTIVFLILEKKKRKASKIDSTEGPISKRNWIQRIYVSHYLIAYLILGFVFYGFWNHKQLEIQKKRIEKLRETTAALRLKNSQLQGFGMLEKYYGKPPRPKRLAHPVGLSQTYYRGNDERSPELYNGGYYRTSKMHLRLLDGNGKPLTHGKSFPEEGAQIEFTFNKPPGTSENLYQEDVINKTYISKEYPVKFAADDPEKVEVRELEKGQKWVIRYPIRPKKKNAESMDGILYVYFGKRLDLGIVYNIRLKEGRIADLSDIWMGNLLCMPKLLPPNDFDYLTQEEWFDYKPIPIAKRHKKHSAKLLGEDEHLKQKEK